jgi:hypothetical protein
MTNFHSLRQWTKYKLKGVYKGELHPGFIVQVQEEGSFQWLIRKPVPFRYGMIFTDQLTEDFKNNQKCHYLMYVRMGGLVDDACPVLLS